VVDVLVNIAGISAIVPAEETTLAGSNRILAVNLTGPFLMSRDLVHGVPFVARTTRRRGSRKAPARF